MSEFLPPPPGMSGPTVEPDLEESSASTSSSTGATVKEWSVIGYDPITTPSAETFLPGLWQRMHDDGTFQMFYHERPEITFLQFVHSLVDPTKKVKLIIGYDENGTAVAHAGMLMLTDILDTPQTKRANAHFVFFREYWNRSSSIVLGYTALKHFFDEMKFDVLIGLIPKQNRAALMFIHRIGFQLVGELPAFTVYKGQRCPGVVNHITVERWRSVRDSLSKGEAQNG